MASSAPRDFAACAHERSVWVLDSRSPTTGLNWRRAIFIGCQRCICYKAHETVSHATRNIDRKFLFVTGKGGVGKSTVSVAVARGLVRSGRRVLLAVTEKAQVGAMLGGIEITTSVKAVEPRLSVLWVEP